MSLLSILSLLAAIGVAWAGVWVVRELLKWGDE
jgi:hypothetical protein